MESGAWFPRNMSERSISEHAPVWLDLAASSEEEVIRQLIGRLRDCAEVRDPEAFERAVLERQKLQPPLLGNGVALPHARTPAVTEMVLAMGRCREPVPFGPERVPIRLVFLYGVPARCITGYLDDVAHLTRSLRKPGTLEALLAARDEATFRSVLT